MKEEVQENQRQDLTEITAALLKCVLLVCMNEDAAVKETCYCVIKTRSITLCKSFSLH